MVINNKTIEDKLFCYICKKIIKHDGQCIGKNLKNLELHKHQKCKSYNLTDKEREEARNWESYPETK